MYLYSLTLNQATAVSQIATGSFSAPNENEMVLAKGKILELVRQERDSSKLTTIYRQEVFGLIRCIKTFRLLAMQRDFLVVGSDSGRIVILDYNAQEARFVKVHQETFGKTGVRRIVPGEFLGCDPKGRAIMIGAAEKQKFVYILNRDSANKITISSPLEAHKPNTITLDMVGVDVGIENPQFACLEIDYGDFDSKQAAVVTGEFQTTLTLYEMDLGLNHVVRKVCTPVDNTAHALIPVPGHPDGPGGLLVLCENFIVYKRYEHPDRQAYYPQRWDKPKQQPVFISCFSSLGKGETLFMLLQTDMGDLLKVTLDSDGDQVHGLSVQYFDTIAPCTAISILRTGYMFAAAECNNHLLYKVLGVGDEEENLVKSHSSNNDASQIPCYNPREPRNLEAEDEMLSLAMATDMKVADLNDEGSPQIYVTCGRGAQSTLRVLKHGLAVIEIGVT